MNSLLMFAFQLLSAHCQKWAMQNYDMNRTNIFDSIFPVCMAAIIYLVHTQLHWYLSELTWAIFATCSSNFKNYI